MGLEVDEVKSGQVFGLSSGSPLPTIIRPMIHTHLRSQMGISASVCITNGSNHMLSLQQVISLHEYVSQAHAISAISNQDRCESVANI